VLRRTSPTTGRRRRPDRLLKRARPPRVVRSAPRRALLRGAFRSLLAATRRYTGPDPGGRPPHRHRKAGSAAKAARTGFRNHGGCRRQAMNASAVRHRDVVRVLQPSDSARRNSFSARLCWPPRTVHRFRKARSPAGSRAGDAHGGPVRSEGGVVAQAATSVAAAQARRIDCAPSARLLKRGRLTLL